MTASGRRMAVHAAAHANVTLGVTLALALGLLTALPAAADWLVMKDGSRVETRGPWKVDGRQLVFHLPDGTLSSLRLSEVDLGASETHTRRASEEAAKPAAPAVRSEQPERPPRRKLTNADLAAGAAPAEGLAEAEEAEEAGAEEAGDEGDRPSIEITGWEERRDDFDGSLGIEGTVRNTRPGVTAMRAEVSVLLFDHEGAQIAAEVAQVVPSSLTEGGVGRFEVRFPGVFVYDALTFRASSIDLVQSTEAGDEATASAP